MSNNSFSTSQIKLIYSDENFLNYISDYFSTYGTREIELNYGSNDSDLEKNWKMYLRVFLANSKSIIQIFDSLNKKPSYSYKEIETNIKGVIKGRLNLNKYVHNKTMIKMPRVFPCLIKEKSYDNVENEYVFFILNKVMNLMKKVLNLFNHSNLYKGKETEYRELVKLYNHTYSMLKSDFFSSLSILYGASSRQSIFPSYKMNHLNARFLKGKIRNSNNYKYIFDYYKKIEKYGLTYIDSSNLKYLVYDETFDDKLFEIWNLYNIYQCLNTKFGFNTIQSNPLYPGQNDFIYNLNNNSCVIEIYYQKGKGLYWDDNNKQTWRFAETGNGLIGIPDISLKIHNTLDRIITIDAKNKVRYKGENSDEIYKVIGYFDNFENYLKNVYGDEIGRVGILIYRNDIEHFEEKVIRNTNDVIYTFSVGIDDNNDDFYFSQIERLCNIILEYAN